MLNRNGAGTRVSEVVLTAWGGEKVESADGCLTLVNILSFPQIEGMMIIIFANRKKIVSLHFVNKGKKNEENSISPCRSGSYDGG